MFWRILAVLILFANFWMPQPKAEAYLFANYEMEKMVGGITYSNLLDKSYADKRLLEVFDSVEAIMPEGHRIKGFVVRVVRDEQWNAFCVPNGVFYVTEGMMKNFNDDDLAAIIGHEIGHSQHNDWGRLFEAQMLTSVGMNYLANTHRVSNEAATIGGSIINIALSRGYGFAAEYDADKYSFLCLSTKNSKYSPAGQAIALMHLQNYVISKGGEPGGVANFINPHPPLENRINYQRKLLEDWAKNKVKIDANTGVISTARGLELFRPFDKEAGYKAMGWIAKSINYPGTIESGVDSEGRIWLGGEPLGDANGQADIDFLRAKLKEFGFKIIEN